MKISKYDFLTLIQVNNMCLINFTFNCKSIIINRYIHEFQSIQGFFLCIYMHIYIYFFF